jgi:MFS family permease
MSAAAPGSPGTLSVLKKRPFLALWIGQMISAIGDYFSWLAMLLTVRKLTGSNFAMSLSMISLAVPTLLLGPLAGVMVDRWDRRRTMIVSDIGRALTVLLCLLATSRERVWIFFLVGLIQSAFGQFFFPARSAVVPLLVHEEELVAANGLMQMTMVVSLTVGAGLAGATIQAFGANAAFLVNSLGFLLSALAVALMRVPRAAAASPAAPKAVAHEFREGLQFLFSSRTLIGLIISLSVLQLGMGAIEVIWVPFLQDTFHVGPGGIGLTDGLFGGGMAVGALGVGALSRRFRKVWLSGVGMAYVGLFIGLYGCAPAFWWVLLCTLLLGVIIPTPEAALTTIMQLSVPDEKRGRVSGTTNAIVTITSILSMAAAGGLSQVINPRYLFFISGALGVVAGVLTLLLVAEPPASPASDGLAAAAETLPLAAESTLD